MNVGFIGVGAIAIEHARSVIQLGHNVNWAACRYPESDRAHKFKSVVGSSVKFTDIDGILARCDIDAYVVCLPWDLTALNIGRLLGHRAPMLLEKPIHYFTYNLKDELSSAPLNSLETKVVGMNRRFFQPVQELRERILQGGLRSVDITISETLERLVNRYGKAVLRHVLAYSSCHILDLALYFFGNLNVASMSARPDVRFPDFQCFNGLLYSGNVPVHISLNSDDPSPVGIRVRFDDHETWHLSPIERLSVYRGHTICEPAPDNNVRLYAPTLIRSVLADTTSRPGIHEQMRCFLAGDFSRFATPNDFLNILDLSDRLRSAAGLRS